NPMVPNGTKALPALVNSLPQNFRYEPGMIVADGDLVMLHGRYTGFGPEPLVVVDIFRLKDGKIVEHWDVMQKDQPASETKNGNPMFSPDEAR
ncbi:MAG: nuclear transport factor 2 family protein, partial [Marinobacter sp.]|nr:nuclear transport factor 2 family protein [Marinobacter sp.]